MIAVDHVPQPAGQNLRPGWRLDFRYTALEQAQLTFQRHSCGIVRSPSVELELLRLCASSQPMYVCLKIGAFLGATCFPGYLPRQAVRRIIGRNEIGLHGTPFE